MARYDELQEEYDAGYEAGRNDREEELTNGVIKQLTWERDMAINQLRDLGYGFAEKVKEGDERCGNCVKLRKCKELIDGEWKWFYICPIFMDEKNGWALVVGRTREELFYPSNRCEVWEGK